MGVECEDTQLQHSLVCTEIRLWPPRPPHVPPSLPLSRSLCDYRLLSLVPLPDLSRQTFVLLHVLHGKTGTIGARCQMRWISVLK